MMKMIKFVLLALFTMPAFAVGVDYVTGEVDSKVMGCDNPTTRTDGMALPIDEIDRVEMYVDDVDPAVTPGDAPQFTVMMMGGCTDTSFDLNQLSVGQWYQWAVVYDTGARESEISDVLPFVRLAPIAPPSKATGIR